MDCFGFQPRNDEGFSLAMAKIFSFCNDVVFSLVMIKFLVFAMTKVLVLQ